MYIYGYCNSMFTRISIILLVFLSACFNKTQNKEYSITTYVTTIEDVSHSNNKLGQKFKYSYEEYNADSNLIYQELYSTTDNIKDKSKLTESTKFFYNAKQKIKEENRWGNGNIKSVETYEYTNGQLTKMLLDGKAIEGYKYDEQGNLAERRSMDFSIYDRYTYDNGVKTKTVLIEDDTIKNVESFIYDNNKHLIEEYGYNNKGEKVYHKLIIRNNKGQATEEKWRESYSEWRLYNNGMPIDSEFYESNKYYYDSLGRRLKTEYYDIGRLAIVYEFEYN